MPATWDKFHAQSAVAKKLANRLRDLRAQLRLLLECHAFNGFASANDPTPPPYLRLDDQGNIKGQDFGPADYLELVAFAAEVEKLVTGVPATSANYRATLERMADPGHLIT